MGAILAFAMRIAQQLIEIGIACLIPCHQYQCILQQYRQIMVSLKMDFGTII